VDNKLDELLGDYFDCGVAEGREGRTHDTIDGQAQKALHAIKAHVTGLLNKEREACAALLSMSSQQIRLMAGEMSSHEMQVTQAALAGVKRKITAQDLRTAKAVLSGVKSKIDQRKN
jgi:hypothetical protein